MLYEATSNETDDQANGRKGKAVNVLEHKKHDSVLREACSARYYIFSSQAARAQHSEMFRF